MMKVETWFRPTCATTFQHPAEENVSPDAWKRKLLHGLLDRVVLKRSPGRGKNAVPVAERTQILLRGNMLLEPVWG